MHDHLSIQYIASLADISAQASKNTINFSYSSDYSLLPLAVRYISPDNSTYVIERPPFKATIDYSLNNSYRNRRTLKSIQQKEIWVPWTVSIITVKNSHPHYTFKIYFNDSPLNSFDDYLVPCFFPNSDRTGSICMGQDTNNLTNTIGSQPKITEIYNYLFNSYFGGGWNSDLNNDPPNWNYFVETGIAHRVNQTVKNSVNYTNPPQHWNMRRSLGAAHANSLYFFSQISLQEFLDYITYVKMKNAEQQSRYSYVNSFNNILEQTSQRTHQITLQEESFSLNFRDSIYNLINNNFSFDNILSHNYYNVDIVGYDSSIPLSDYYRNPYIISQIYLSLLSDDNQIRTSYNFSDIKQYLIKDEIPNAISS